VFETWCVRLARMVADRSGFGVFRLVSVFMANPDVDGTPCSGVFVSVRWEPGAIDLYKEVVASVVPPPEAGETKAY